MWFVEWDRENDWLSFFPLSVLDKTMDGGMPAREKRKKEKPAHFTTRIFRCTKELPFLSFFCLTKRLKSCSQNPRFVSALWNEWNEVSTMNSHQRPNDPEMSSAAQGNEAPWWSHPYLPTWHAAPDTRSSREVKRARERACVRGWALCNVYVSIKTYPLTAFRTAELEDKDKKRDGKDGFDLLFGYLSAA